MEPLGIEDFSEPSQFALQTIQLRMLVMLAETLGTNLSRVKALNNASPRPSDVDFCELWGQLQEEIAAVLAEHYSAVVDIASTNPTCADPAGWADRFMRECLTRSMSSPTDEEDDSFEDAILTEYESGFQESRVELLKDLYAQVEGDSVGDSILAKHESGFHATRVELLTDLYAQVDLGLGTAHCDATIRLARSGWRAHTMNSDSTLSKSTLPAEVIPPFAALKFTLPDLGEPPSGASVNDVVREMRPQLTQAIKDARSCLDRASSSNTMTQEAIRKQFPLLECVTDAEYDRYIVGRGEKPHKASGLLMAGRAELPIETIDRYGRPTPPGRSKSKGKAKRIRSKTKK